MKVSELKSELVDELYRSCIRHLEYLVAELESKTVFSYTIFCSAGCRSIGVASCTREAIELRKSLDIGIEGSLVDAEVNAQDWDYVNNHYDIFTGVDQIVDRLYEVFYDGEIEDVDLDEFDDDELWSFISGFFVEAVCETVERIRLGENLNSTCFEEDLLLGMQFSDPDQYALEMMEKASQILNSDSWHKKLMTSINLQRLNLPKD